VALCLIELTLAIVGFSIVLWIKTTKVNENIKDFIIGLVVAIYFFVSQTKKEQIGASKNIVLWYVFRLLL